MLDEVPNLVEIEGVLKYFKKGKSSGLDGLTIEVLFAS